jgi:hypothetical protein
MPDYSKGKIYKICSNDGDMEKVYYGSTCISLGQRMAKHRWSFKNSCDANNAREVFKKYGLENCHIELIKLFPCGSKEELTAEEYKIIRQFQCVNKQGKGIGKKALAVKWRETHKERLGEKHICQCGGKYTTEHKTSHFKTKLHQTYLSNI